MRSLAHDPILLWQVTVSKSKHFLSAYSVSVTIIGIGFSTVKTDITPYGRQYDFS